MNNSRTAFAAALFLVVTLPSIALAHQAQQVTPPTAAKPVPAAHQVEDPGQRAFEANCSRCHQAPETLNPRITGTVIRHMRVRANLSAQDEKNILRFLNP